MIYVTTMRMLYLKEDKKDSSNILWKLIKYIYIYYIPKNDIDIIVDKY